MSKAKKKSVSALAPEARVLSSGVLEVREGPVTPYLVSRHSRVGGNPVPLVSLPQAAVLNPRGFDQRPSDDDLVSFVPMKAVEEESGRLSAAETRLWSDVKKGYTPFQDGDVIFAKITPCMENGKYALAAGLHDGRAAGSTEFHVFRPKPGLDSKYLLHFLFTPELRSRARMNMKGAAGQLRVPTQFFSDVRIPLPPLAEQHRIVAELETQLTRLDASVTALKRVQANLKRYRSSVLKAACEGRLVPTEAELAGIESRNCESGSSLLETVLASRRSNWKGRGKFKEPIQANTESLPQLPSGWCWATVDQLGEVGTGATPNRGKAIYYDRGSIPWITSGAVRDAFVRDASEFVTEKAIAETNLTLYPVGTLLVAMYGEGKTRGKCSELLIAATTNQALAAIEAAPSVKAYLKVFLLMNYEETRKAASGGVQPNLNLSIIRSICVPLPPKLEQMRIVAEVERLLSVIEELEVTVAANLKRAERLRQSVLARAFGG